MLSFRIGAAALAVAGGVSLLVTTGIAQQAPPAPPPMPAILQNYAPVTAERLKNPEAANWLSIRRTYDGQAFSPLTQLTPENVGKLKLVWSFVTGERQVHEAPPLVNNGVMFVTSPNNVVTALDATTGNLLWRSRRPRPTGSFVAHEVNRGAALYGDKVYVAAGEGVLYALDAKTGKEVWATTVADNKSGYYTTLAPLAAGGVIMLGASGGEFGVRGFVAAFDPDTGKEKWRTYTIPAPGEPGSETWPRGEQWKTGGAPVWVTGNYDAETNIAYWGTGNGGPWMGDKRPGDNLYSASTIALDVATGKIKGHFQYHPNDSWDWDEVSPPLLVDFQRGGRTVKGLVNAARDGYLWFLDRGPLKDTGGKVKFVEGKPFVYQTVFKSLDPVTGRPEVDESKKPGTGKSATYCPGLHGGKNWFPAAFNPQTRLIYIPANNNLCATSQGTEVAYEAGKGFTGVRMEGNALAPGADHVGELQAWNVDTGQKVWTHNYMNSPNWGGVLTTAGGLVFHGGTADRKLHAFDAKTGKLVWETPTSSGIEAPPVSFQIGGKQYIAVNSGWGGDSRGMQATLNRMFPGQYPEVPEGGSVWVYAIE